jgi:DDE family transposase
MEILKQALNKINSINKKQYDFFIILIYGLIGITGKRTFRNLARYMQITEHTFARQMSKVFDFVGLNVELIKTLGQGEGEEKIAVQDATFVPKSGDATHGIDFFWNGCASKPEKGLELDVIGIVKIGKNKKESYTISAEQTPADPRPMAERKKKKPSEPSRIDFYLGHLKKVIAKILALGIKYIAVDALFVKEKYVNGAVALGLHVIGKLRKDARFRRIYTGPQKPRGRKKQFETGRVKIDDFKDSEVIKIVDEKKEIIELRSCVVHSVSLKRTIKAVLVTKRIGDKCGEAILFGTDVELDAVKIYQYYVSRFQIEFVFRDAKNFTGLTDAQTRNEQRLHYHFNASLTALNVAKIQDHELQKKERTQHAFSMTNWARKYHVEIVINRIIAMFGLELTSIKSHPDYDEALSFGNIKH